MKAKDLIDELRPLLEKLSELDEKLEDQASLEEELNEALSRIDDLEDDLRDAQRKIEVNEDAKIDLLALRNHALKAVHESDLDDPMHEVIYLVHRIIGSLS